ncbi:DUF4440 domain-containing protein [Enemella dayhoffiae]|uniref:Ribonuclease H n=1 Tax=Enemella dayhoffiae TaxID=2016507 RepID=A0A255HBM9_9ACTN|nr:ribonuclease HI family protein [Enemella dayhoffiae]OYO25049.1 DUF4440 domain-containing protein [Enemella dayhoffiae]
MTITAAADGSALGNPGPAGWAWYVDDSCWAAGGWPHGTNNMGELMAVLDLLQQTAHVDDDLLVLCDSQYAINVISKWTPGWKRKNWRKADGKPVQNVELVKALDAAMQGRRVRFEWVKGHAGHELNEAADQRARAVAVAYQQGTRPDPGPGFPDGGRDHPDVRPNQTEPVPALFEVDSLTDELADSPEDYALPGDERADPDPDDLFAADEVPGLDLAVAAGERVVELERALLSEAVRSDPSQVAALLHPDFCEIGASGRLWTRAEILSRIGPLDPAVELEVLEVQALGSDELLLLWRSTSGERAALRSSLWVRGESDWVQRFHQGTPEA